MSFQKKRSFDKAKIKMENMLTTLLPVITGKKHKIHENATKDEWYMEINQMVTKFTYRETNNKHFRSAWNAAMNQRLNPLDKTFQRQKRKANYLFNNGLVSFWKAMLPHMTNEFHAIHFETLIVKNINCPEFTMVWLFIAVRFKLEIANGQCFQALQMMSTQPSFTKNIQKIILRAQEQEQCISETFILEEIAKGKKMHNVKRK